MIKLLIADDEHIVIDSIKFIIDKYVHDVEVVGSAKSGKEAIEKSLQLKPDVVFMDIHMPGINGIDAIRHIREHNREIIFVIITAYEYFQYAKDAVNLGVYEYMLKPLNKNAIIEILQDIGAVINSKRQSLEKETALLEKISKILPHMEGQFIYSQLFKSDVVKDIAFFEEVFAMGLTEGSVMVVMLDELQASNKEEGLLNTLIKQKLYEHFRVELKDACSCLIGMPLLDRIVAYIPVGKNADSYEARNNAIEMAKNIIEKTAGNYRIGIGRCCKMEDFSESYQEAYRAAVQPGADRVTHYEDMLIISPLPEDYPRAIEKAFLHSFMIGELQGTLEQFEELHSWMVMNYQNDHARIKSKLIELFIMTQRAVPAANLNVSGNSEFLLQLLKTDDSCNIKVSCVNYLKNTLKELDEHRNKELNGLIAKASQYIEQNYKHNINLNDVAKTVNMSYHYFSRFFKESTGKNFIDYLTELRIEKAMLLLKDSNVNIKMVCYEVGYSDPNYFSKIFKKNTGMTPTEYRNQSIPEEVAQSETD